MIMTRDIKFRAWDWTWEWRLNEKMISINLDWELWYNHEDTLVNSLKDLADKVEIMQYTGLKDKNWVEIYEGDILSYKVEIWHYHLRMVERDQVRARLHIMKMWKWVSIQNTSMPKQSTMDKNWTVIWNIYENPDLLNNSTNA
jgi:uncharacterized phage protein (TIGR01671 family)